MTCTCGATDSQAHLQRCAWQRQAETVECHRCGHMLYHHRPECTYRRRASYHRCACSQFVVWEDGDGHGLYIGLGNIIG